MQLKNEFEVALPPEEAWKVLLDVERIAPCMPGAELTEVVDDTAYRGKVSVRLGPVALTFNGVVRFEEVDEANKRAAIKARGTDIKGRGGADATAMFRIEPCESGSKVLVDTDLNLSGTVAQYGRASGMVQSVAGQLIGQFATNLEQELAGSQAGAAPSAEAATSTEGEGATLQEMRPVQVKPISGFRLIWSALKDWLQRVFMRA